MVDTKNHGGMFNGHSSGWSVLSVKTLLRTRIMCSKSGIHFKIQHPLSSSSVLHLGTLAPSSFDPAGVSGLCSSSIPASRACTAAPFRAPEPSETTRAAHPGPRPAAAHAKVSARPTTAAWPSPWLLRTSSDGEGCFRKSMVIGCFLPPANCAFCFLG